MTASKTTSKSMALRKTLTTTSYKPGRQTKITRSSENKKDKTVILALKCRITGGINELGKKSEITHCLNNCDGQFQSRSSNWVESAGSNEKPSKSTIAKVKLNYF